MRDKNQCAPHAPAIQCKWSFENQQMSFDTIVRGMRFKLKVPALPTKFELEFEIVCQLDKDRLAKMSTK